MKIVLVTAIVLCFCLTAFSVPILQSQAEASTPVITLYPDDRSGWESAVGAYEEECFTDATLNPGVSVVSEYPGYVDTTKGVWWDRLVCPAYGMTTTTWHFSTPISGFGGSWDPGVPGGPGAHIALAINGAWVNIGEIPNTYTGQFWGFVSSEPFHAVRLSPGSYCGIAWCETYELDNMVYAFQGVVKIVAPSEGDTFWIEAEPEPTMPRIVARAELVGIAPTPPLTITEFVWNAKIRYTDHGRNDCQTLGPKSMLGETYTSWVPEYKNLILGGEMEIEVYVDIGGKRYQDKISVHIRGRDPSKETVKDTLGQLILQVICYKESYPKWHQFNDSGLPVFGPPSGFGLMQLDPPSTNVQIWSWRANINEGKSRWREKIAMSRAYVRQVKKADRDQKVTNLSPEQEKRQAAYLYRGGCWVGGEFQYYYIWSRSSERWEKNPNAEPTSVEYAADAMAIKEAVSSGNPPEDW